MRRLAGVVAGVSLLALGITGCQQEVMSPEASADLSRGGNGNSHGQGETVVQICHFRGHTAPEPWNGAGTTLDGDYVIQAHLADSERARSYCLDHGGQGLIWVAESAARHGHDAQLLDRISGYE